MPPKRKRNETASDASARPSPHQPSDTALGQHEQDNRRRSGPGRNTRARNSERRDSNGGQPGTFNTSANNASVRGPVSPSVTRPSSSSSQALHSQHSNLSTVQIAPSASQPPNPIPSNYNFLVLTDARISSWHENGRLEVVQHGITSRNDEDVEEVSTISQEFARATIDGRLSPMEAGACMKEILGSEPEAETSGFNFDAHSLFIDTISIFVETEEATPKTQLRDFILAVGLSPKLLRQVLEASALEHLGLIRQSFQRFGIRYATNQLYRQSNYNLLREESEGFSKLITEVYQSSHSMNQELITREVVEAAFERVKALIGTFDLDVGRVLDIVFDIFAATMMRTFRYFTLFLRVSSWWPRSQIEQWDPVLTGGLPKWALSGAPFELSPEEKTQMDEKRLQRDINFWERARTVHFDAFFELGGRQISDTGLERLLSGSTDAGLKTEFDVEWAKATKTRPPPGNRVAAQLFGFKLRFYTSEAREKDDIIPANLIFMAAYLIKVGFISLIDLYGHLWPEDDKMEAAREKRLQVLEEKEKKDRQGAEPNALLRAGALKDDEPPRPSPRIREAATTKVDANPKESNDPKAEEVLPEPAENLKVDLVQHLLLVGAIPEALFMLGRFPWLVDAYPEEIIAPINRILLHSIDKVYQDTLANTSGLKTKSSFKSEADSDQSGVSKWDVKITKPNPPRVFKWPHANGFNRGQPYEYYLKEWVDNVPVCQTVKDVFTLCATFLNISGVNIGRNPILLKKVTAIGAKSLQEDQSQHNIDKWQDLLKRIIFPALNLCNSNVDVVAAVWNLLKNYPTQVRFTIYAECYKGQISRLPAMAKAYKFSRLDTLAILKRLSLQNIPMSAKNLAKVALYAPGCVCIVALEQIEAYSNLIEAFVECAKYFTDLGQDVLVWSLLTALGGAQRSRTQESSVLLTSKWLQALSKFSGKVFRRYGNMDATPVLQYVNEQLAQGNSTDLVILRELITSMGGIVSDIDFTDAQLAALSGGEELRRQTLINLGDQRFESLTTKSATRLMKALVNSNLATKLLTNMAQYRQSAIYKLPENETHIKFLATVIDDSQQALAQYVELLRGKLSPEQFDDLVPGIPLLMSEYGIDANLAFLIGRASLAYQLTGPGATATKGRRLSGASENGTDGEGDVSMDSKDASIATVPTTDPPSTDEQMTLDDQEPKERSFENSSTPVSNGRKSDRFLDVLQPIIDAVQTMLPAEIWHFISPEFYVLFWSLQTNDLGIPASSYNAESIRLQKEQDYIKKDRSDMSKTGHVKREQRKQDITQLATKLASEASQCQERVGKTRMLLLKSAPGWLPAKSNAAADTVIEECLIPRIILSPVDADFCHKMIKFLHDYQVANFKITTLYDRFFSVNRIRSMIFSCTVREAEFLGRFIKSTLGELSKWHKNKDTYDKEAVKGGKHAGFAIAFDDEGKPSAMMEHGQFRDLLWSWHRNLATALKTCLQETEWMHIRNAITILKAVLDYFPAVDFLGKQFLQILTKIQKREEPSKTDGDEGQSHRVDLSVTAGTALSALKKHEQKWVMVQAFRPNITGDSSDDKKAAESTLRPNAPDFQPRQDSSGFVRTKAIEDEDDGEVTDAKLHPINSALGEGHKNDSEASKSAPSQRSERQTAIPTRTAELARSSSRPSTPTTKSGVPSPASNARRDISKPSTISSLPAPPGLPSRPDVPFPSHFTHNERGQIRISEHGHTRDHHEPRESREHRDSRGPREPRDGREPREPRETRDPRDLREPRPTESARSSRVRETNGNDRRVPEILPAESSRSERDRPRRLDGPPRWDPNERDGRTSRDRVPSSSSTGGHGAEPSRPTRDAQSDAKAMPPPPPALPETQGPMVNPERARLIGADEMINPARAALIGDSGSAGGRRPKEESRDRSSRHSSPQRRGERSEPRSADVSRDDRSNRSHRSDHQVSSRDNRSEPTSSAAPRGERGDRDAERPTPDRPRDLNPFQGASSGLRSEPDHGRSNQQDPNYGRLNAISSITDMANAPDAPRGRGRARAPPVSNQPPNHPDTRFPNADQSHRGPSPERQLPPTGPASSRPRRGPSIPGHGNSSLNTPAAAGSQTPGIHPDRLRHLGAGPGTAPASQAPPSFPSSGVNSVGVHPDRMNQIAGTPPTGPSHGRSLPPLQTPDRPSIPSNNNSSRQSSAGHPMTPGTDKSNPMSAPTGPAATNDRSRTGSRRQLAGINNVLQAGTGGSLRSRGSRTNLAGSDAQILTGASPISTPVHERPDPLASDRGINGDDRSHRSDRSRRNHDHRSSRHTSRERDSERESRSKEHREYRDREVAAAVPGNGRDGEHNSSRRSGREYSHTGRDLMAGSGRGEPSSGRGDVGRELRHGSRHDEHGRGNGGGRGGSRSGAGPQGGDEHRLRGANDDGRGSRKRVSEEGVNFLGPPDRSKRLRR